MRPPRICWILDSALLERQYQTGFPSLAEAAKEAGHYVYETRYIPFSQKADENIPFNETDCVISHGCIQFNNQIIRDYGKKLCPLAYLNDNVKNWNKFASRLQDHLLNDDYIILPYKEALRRFRNSTQESMFIKPHSGLKEFTGFVLYNNEDFDHEINSMQALSMIDPETLCVCSSVKEIQAEFRYLIAEGKVIDGSEYRWDNVLDVRIDTLPECDKLAKTVAGLEWQADVVYMCDVAMTPKGPKVIELNSFSSSGLYALDTRKVVDAVGKAAYREFTGEIFF